MSKTNIFFVFIFFGALLLRMGLALHNIESNDPHMPVIRFIMRNDGLPEKSDCWECFQPKLFHYIGAKLLEFIGLEKPGDADMQKKVLQLLNLVAAGIVLLIAWMFIYSQSRLYDEVKILGFAFLALNPQFIGINSQVTNDTFLILFCVLAIYFAHLFLKQGRWEYYFLTTFFGVLAVLTKTNAWVSVIAITISLLIAASVPQGERLKKLSYAVAYPLLVVVFAVASPLSQYTDNIKKFGSPILLNIEKQTAPLVFEKTYIPFAGILSVQDGFFTFKLGDLLENPITPLIDQIDGTSHRTSFWTRLYGSAVSVHYENYPPSWRLKNNSSFVLYRGMYILALLPLSVLLIGMIREAGGLFKGFFGKDKELLEGVSYGLFVLLFVGYMLFAALYAFQYRTYNVIKAVFIYPGLLAYVYFFLRALQDVFSNRKFLGIFKTVTIILLTSLLILCVVDVLILYFGLLSN